MVRIGFIGLGVMGLQMSKRILESGYQLIVYDIDPTPVVALEKLGAQKAESPENVSSQAEVVISMLPTPAITREVTLGKRGIVHGFCKGSTYIDMSTSSPKLTLEIYQVLGDKGIQMLDAPVSGGMEGAKAGTLTIIVGGDQEVFKKVRPILGCMGKNIFHVGKIGTGHIIKLINNMLFAINMAATSEALVLGTKAGVDLGVLREIMNKSSGRSYALDVKVKDFILPRNFQPGFAVDLENKDLDLALELGKNLGVPLIMGNLVRQLYQALVVKGYGNKDTSVIITLFEDLMGAKEIKKSLE